MSNGALGTLAPDGIVVREARDLDEAEPLHAVEAAAIQDAVPLRRREFITARRLAREALAAGGWHAQAIPQGPRGEPVWPDGATGSLTHCGGYIAAVVGPAVRWASLGIDAEPDALLPDGVLATVAGDEERSHLHSLQRSHPATAWDRLLFCVKEATYKAWFPLTCSWLGFDQAHVTLDPVHGTFASRLLVPGPQVDGVRVQQFEGRWSTRKGVLACITGIPRAPCQDSRRPFVDADPNRRTPTSTCGRT